MENFERKKFLGEKREKIFGGGRNLTYFFIILKIPKEGNFFFFFFFLHFFYVWTKRIFLYNILNENKSYLFYYIILKNFWVVYIGKIYEKKF